MSNIPLDASFYIDRDSDEFIVICIELSHSSVVDKIRLCNHPVTQISEYDGQPRMGLYHKGQEYMFLPMFFNPPIQQANTDPVYSFTMFAVSEMKELIRRYGDRCDFNIFQVTNKNTERNIANFPLLQLSKISINGATIEGSMMSNPIASLNYPMLMFDNTNFTTLRG